MKDHTDRNRRDVLKGLGGVAAGTAIAGCMGGNGEDNGNGNGGDTPTDSGGDTPTDSGGDTGGTETESLPSHDSTMGIVAKELNQIPSIHALQSMLPETTNDQLGGSVRTFESSSLPMQALVSGNIDYYALSFGNVVQAYLSGNEVITLGPKLTGTDYQFVVREDIEADSLEEVVNGDYTIGVAGLGGLSHTQVAGVLAQEGLPTDTDENGITSVGGSSARTSAIASGQIDATAIHIDQVARLKNNDAGVRVLFDFREYYPNFINQTYTVTRDFLESDVGSAHTRHYMQRAVEAHEAATQNFEFVYTNMDQYVEESLSREDARSSWEFNAETIETWKYTKDGYNSEDFQQYIQALNAANVLDDSQVEQINLDDILNQELWNTAVENKNVSRWIDSSEGTETTSG